jgi:periplasmic protein TonB
MFADSMLETSWAQRSRRNWMTLTSFGLQAAVIGVLLLLPLIRPVALPFLKPLQTPVSLAAAPAAPPVEPHARSAATPESNRSNVLMQPSRIPTVVANIAEDPGPPPVGISGAYIPGAPSAGGLLGTYGSTGGPANPVVPLPPKPTVSPLRISKMMEGNLIRRVQPAYPPLARSARIQGQVVLSATISKVGAIENLRVLTGHPMLVGAAIDAVRQWRYRPYILNNEPVEVETQITVNFSLSGS